ncbi:hypothetical protein Pfo_022634 [Paulownia fortunei]|nr:hypothetical protein Pfo_022634 [Paulownia fortunei]
MGNKLGMRRQVVDDKYTKPQGLYQHKDVDHKKLRKLILDSKLAPCYPGDDDCSCDLEECPICFLYYPSLNRSRCCMKGICTECFLQMKTPNSTCPMQRCPFCKTSNYAVEFRGVKTKEEKGLEQIEEQRVIEAKIRMRQQELQDEEAQMLKRREISSSSSMRGPNEVHYCSTRAPSFASVIEREEVFASHESCAASEIRLPACQRQNREDESDLDLEDIMVMEAIWLSIQENGRCQDPPSTDAAHFEDMVEDHCSNEAGEWVDNRSAVAEVGTSYGGSDEFCDALRPVALPQQDESQCSRQPVTGTIIPGNFEEQMMLAMAVSLAEAQARTNTLGVAWH